MNEGKKMDVSMSLEVSQVLVASLEAFLIKSILKLLPEQFYLYIFNFTTQVTSISLSLFRRLEFVGRSRNYGQLCKTLKSHP